MATDILAIYKKLEQMSEIRLFRKVFLLTCLSTVIAFISATMACVSPVAAQQVPSLEQKLSEVVDQYPHMVAGVSLINNTTQERISINGGTQFPLASVFKVAVMVELARQIQNGELALTLDSPITLRESDKCIGSGSYQNLAAGTRIPLHQLVEKMITVSDNTATDIIVGLIGSESINRMLAKNGLKHSDIYLKNRTAWLISLGQGSRFVGQAPYAVAQEWHGLSATERHDIARVVEHECSRVSLRTLQKLEDASATNVSHWQQTYIAATIDNTSSPDDQALLLTKLWKGQLLNESWTSYCLGVLKRQKYNSRLPKLLPRGTAVYHKTGTLSGIINDVGIIVVPAQQAGKVPAQAFSLAVLVRNVGLGQENRAQDLIAKLSRTAYVHYKSLAERQ